MFCGRSRSTFSNAARKHLIPDDTFFEHVLSEAWQDHADSAHDIGHIRRVVGTAKAIAMTEGAKLEVVVPAAWLHDIVNLPKNHPSRSIASTLAADKARETLHGLLILRIKLEAEMIELGFAPPPLVANPYSVDQGTESEKL